jgi:hypothetical protein
VISGSTLKQLFEGQQPIHGTGAEAFEVEGDEFESQGFEHGGELAGHFSGQSSWKFFTGYFDAHDVAVMAHAELTEAECA